VRVVDSRSLGMALGFAALAAAEAASAGALGRRRREAAAARAARTASIFYVDTLEHLRRGGRIGAAQALLGSALAVKPLLHLVDGRIEPLEKVRTSARAISRLEEVAAEHAGRRLCRRRGAPPGQRRAGRAARRAAARPVARAAPSACQRDRRGGGGARGAWHARGRGGAVLTDRC
jgi:fatty acid-binding protein DegV